MRNKGFEKYEITEFKTDDSIINTKIKVKFEDQEIELQDIYQRISLIGTNLSVVHSLGKELVSQIHGNFISNDPTQSIITLGHEFNDDYKMSFAIKSLNKVGDKERLEKALEWNRKIYRNQDDEYPLIIKKSESDLTYEHSVINSEIWMSNYEYLGVVNKEFGIDIYIDDEALSKLIRYIESDILKDLNIHLYSQRIFTEYMFAAEGDKFLDRYFLFNKSRTPSIFGYSTIEFISKEIVKEKDVLIEKSKIEKKDIQVQKETNYEAKINFIIVLLVIIAFASFFT